MLWPLVRVRPHPLGARRASKLFRSLSDKQRVRAAREMRSQGVIGGAMKRRWDGEGSEEERGQM